MSGGPLTVASDSIEAEAAIMRTVRIGDFSVVSVLGGGEFGMVLLAHCTKPGHPHPSKEYALKAIKNLGSLKSVQLRQQYQAEFELIRRIPPHPGLVRCWTHFTDGIPETVLSLFSPAEQETIRSSATCAGIQREEMKTMYGVFDYHPMTLQGYRFGWGTSVVSFDCFGKFAREVFAAQLHFASIGLVHRDVKLDNIVVKSDGSICFIDLGVAMELPMGGDGKSHHMLNLPRDSPGGNKSHLAPEMLNALSVFVKPTVRETMVDYSGQAVFETGVLLWELATGRHPFGDYPMSTTVVNSSGVSVVKYHDETVWKGISAVYEGALAEADYPAEFLTLIRRMTACNPTKRLSLQRAAAVFDAVFATFLVDRKQEEIDALKLENANLSVDNARLENAVTQAMNEKDKVVVEVNQLRAQNQSLVTERDQLALEKDALNAEIARLKRNLTISQLPPPPPFQLPSAVPVPVPVPTQPPSQSQDKIIIPRKQCAACMQVLTWELPPDVIVELNHKITANRCNCLESCCEQCWLKCCSDVVAGTKWKCPLINCTIVRTTAEKASEIFTELAIYTVPTPKPTPSSQITAPEPPQSMSSTEFTEPGEVAECVYCGVEDDYSSKLARSLGLEWLCNGGKPHAMCESCVNELMSETSESGSVLKYCKAEHGKSCRYRTLFVKHVTDTIGGVRIEVRKAFPTSQDVAVDETRAPQVPNLPPATTTNTTVVVEPTPSADVSSVLRSNEECDTEIAKVKFDAEAKARADRHSKTGRSKNAQENQVTGKLLARESARDDEVRHIEERLTEATSNLDTNALRQGQQLKLSEDHGGNNAHINDASLDVAEDGVAKAMQRVENCTRHINAHGDDETALKLQSEQDDGSGGDFERMDGDDVEINTDPPPLATVPASVEVACTKCSVHYTPNPEMQQFLHDNVDARGYCDCWNDPCPLCWENALTTGKCPNDCCPLPRKLRASITARLQKLYPQQFADIDYGNDIVVCREPSGKHPQQQQPPVIQQPVPVPVLIVQPQPQAPPTPEVRCDGCGKVCTEFVSRLQALCGDGKKVCSGDHHYCEACWKRHFFQGSSGDELATRCPANSADCFVQVDVLQQISKEVGLEFIMQRLFDKAEGKSTVPVPIVPTPIPVPVPIPVRDQSPRRPRDDVVDPLPTTTDAVRLRTCAKCLKLTNDDLGQNPHVIGDCRNNAYCAGCWKRTIEISARLYSTKCPLPGVDCMLSFTKVEELAKRMQAVLKAKAESSGLSPTRPSEGIVNPTRQPKPVGMLQYPQPQNPEPITLPATCDKCTRPLKETDMESSFAKLHDFAHGNTCTSRLCDYCWKQCFAEASRVECGPNSCSHPSPRSTCILNPALAKEIKKELKKPIRERLAEDNAATVTVTPTRPDKLPTSAPRTRPSIQKSDSISSTSNGGASRTGEGSGERPLTAKQIITHAEDPRPVVRAGQQFVLRPYTGSGHRVRCTTCTEYAAVSKKRYEAGYMLCRNCDKLRCIACGAGFGISSEAKAAQHFQSTHL